MYLAGTCFFVGGIKYKEQRFRWVVLAGGALSMSAASSACLLSAGLRSAAVPDAVHVNPSPSSVAEHCVQLYALFLWRRSLFTPLCGSTFANKVSSSLLFLACIGILIPSTARMVYGKHVITGAGTAPAAARIAAWHAGD